MKWRTIERSRSGLPQIYVNPPDWEEFLSMLETNVPGQQHVMCLSQENHEYWTGVENFQSAMALARNGWPVGRDMLMQTTAKLQDLLTVGGDEHYFQFADSGDEVDVGLYLDGEPEHMIEFITRDLKHGKGGRIVKILVNVTTGAGVNMQTAMVRGAFALTLSDILEREGYRVEFQLGELGLGDRGNIFIRTTIKRANEQMDIDRLAFAFGHPAVQRMLFFRYYELQETAVWDVSMQHYGDVGNFNDPDPTVIEIGCLNHAIIHSPADAMAQYQQVFTKLGITLETTTLTQKEKAAA